MNSVIYTGIDLRDDPEFKKEYIPWLMHRRLSYHMDTISFADAANRARLNHEQSYRYLLAVIPKKKRFAKMERSPKDEKVEAIQQYAKCSKRRAKEYLSLLSEQQLETILTSKGGVAKK